VGSHDSWNSKIHRKTTVKILSGSNENNFEPNVENWNNQTILGQEVLAKPTTCCWQKFYSLSVFSTILFYREGKFARAVRGCFWIFKYEKFLPLNYILIVDSSSFHFLQRYRINDDFGSFIFQYQIIGL